MTRASVPCTAWADLRAIMLDLPHATDHWFDGEHLVVVGVTQAELDAAATPERLTPPPPVPASVALWRARAALAQAGMLPAVNAAVAGLGGAAEQWWEYGAEIERAHPRVAQIGAALGLTAAQLDDLFRAAALIEP